MNSKIVMDFGTVIVVISSAFSAWKFAEFCHLKLPDIDPGERNSASGKFSVKSTKEVLLGITGFGPRPVGSISNQKAFEYW